MHPNSTGKKAHLKLKNIFINRRSLIEVRMFFKLLSDLQSFTSISFDNINHIYVVNLQILILHEYNEIMTTLSHFYNRKKQNITILENFNISANSK